MMKRKQDHNSRHQLKLKCVQQANFIRTLQQALEEVLTQNDQVQFYIKTLYFYLQLKACVSELSNQVQEANEQIKNKDLAILELVDVLSKVQNTDVNYFEDQKQEED